MTPSLAKRAVKALIPKEYHFAVRSTGYRMIHFGLDRFCRCCRSGVRAFKPFGPVAPRPNAQCPVCGALERDRLVALYLERHPGLLAGARRVLHVSPERPIAYLLQRGVVVDYVSIDIAEGAAMETMDLTALAFEDGRFDAVYCSNVLEHVAEDRKAMEEIRRVLRPGGWTMILVPLYGETTHEDLSITDPAERTRLYGQPDHVRAYGIDVAERLAAAGLEVHVERPALGLPESEILRQGLHIHEIVFFCRKPERAAAVPWRVPDNVVPPFGRQPALRNRYSRSFVAARLRADAPAREREPAQL